MKALVCTGPKSLHVEEVPSLPLPDNGLRIQTLYTGVSHGTEMGVYRGNVPQYSKKFDPTIRLFLDSEKTTFSYPFRSCDPGVWQLGYSNVGRVIEVGKDVTKFKVGDLVHSAKPHQSEVVCCENERVVKLPDSVAAENAVFFTNLVTVHNAILDSHIKLGDTVVVFGLGVLGQLAVQLAKLNGAFKVYGVDVIEKRRDVALDCGCDAVFDSRTTDVALEIRRLTGGKGPDLVIEASGNAAALHEAIRTCAPQQTVTVLGWYKNDLSQVNLAGEFHHNRIGIKQSQSGSVNPAISNLWDYDRRVKTCVELLSKLKLKEMITTVIPYDNIADAFALIDQHPEDIVQVVLKY